ncbi:MAG: outer membrane lipoprotein-sorting protein [Magnetococcus sp. DMHC-1]|nr:outer membrane lipoprotein-sorting protein [Magnetococcales bacterium]
MKKQIFFLANLLIAALPGGRRLVAIFFFCLIYGWISPVRAMNADDILQAVDQAMAYDSQEMVLRLVNRRGSYEEPPVVILVAKKGGDRLVAMILAPDSMKGVTAFRSGADVWVRIPGKNIEMQQDPLLRGFHGGGIFNNEDLLHLDFHLEYQARLVREDQANWYLELTPKQAWVPYARLGMVVDKEFKLPREVTHYGPGNVLIKTIRYKQMQRFADGPLRPSLLESASPLNAGYVSTLRYGDVRSVAVPETIFDRSALNKIGDYFMRER